MASIRDVALHADVSVTTVSHAISGKRKVSEGVRQRVKTAMEELGYVPSRSAQSLAQGRTRILGLVVPDIGNGYFAELAKGVERTAIAQGYNTFLCTTGFDHARELSYLELVRSRAVDGIVYAAGAPPSGPELARVLGNLPTVLVDEEVPWAPLPTFISDNFEGGRAAATYLLELGHHQTMTVGGPEDLESSAQRIAGFTQAWRDGGGEQPVIASGGFTEKGGYDVVKAHLDLLQRKEVTCVFAANDLMALGILDALYDHRLTSPADISVIGFDDIGAARYARPHLTTIRQDVAALGSSATRAVIDIVEGRSENDARRNVRPVELIVRDSTAPLTT
ncbi:LacI family DNA-binding transcriptional regulator [Nesterenkonia muleiensis]|uniref:LacI family DNA-binding transcriptional regulator n=1 Tax=Nesterenkonia muleiensis TaxID=2282648 RepID=UPI00138FFA34|nr:LacI family DNA-binding transcriptional regulator [Nesterenkonia muleiensis]